MPLKTGTHDIGTLLAITNQSVATYGIDKTAAVLQADLARFNAIVKDDLMASLADITTDRQRIYGASNGGSMVELDEYGRAPTQLQGTPPTVGFPMRMFGFALGWTEKFMQIKTPADVATMQIDAQMAYTKLLLRELRRAFFRSANYTSVDVLVDRISLSIKRLYNADSTLIPNGPNAEVYDGATHTHYLGASSLTAGAVTAAIDTVIEHGVVGPVKVAISSTNEAAFRALAGFLAAQDPRLLLSGLADQLPVRASIYEQNNRLIGYYGPAEVWVKPWAIASYVVVYDSDSGNKPLVMRQRDSTSLQGLRIAATVSLFPLTAQNMEAEFGFGVWNRQKMAVLYTGNATYADPTLA